MRQVRPSFMLLILCLEMVLLTGLSGFYSGSDEGPEWDGTAFLGKVLQ